MNFKALFVAVFFAAMLSVPTAPRAQTIVSEDFTGTTTNSQWYFFNGACLTAGNLAVTTPPNYVPGCVNVLSSYYHLQENSDPYLVGGADGYLGSSTAPTSLAAQVADPSGSGALRFTNGYPYGHGQNGAIVSAAGFPTGAGVQITFKTLTYRGDSGGNQSSGAAHANDGADGMSFFLMDASQPPGIGSWGGSLGYSCSNSNSPYNGLVGAYLGLGIDEYGNFLNGSSNTLGVSNPQSMGDNTASGGGQYANRIGLRGAGSISWANLSSLYGTNPNNTSLPYYPPSLAYTCINPTTGASIGTLVPGSGTQYQCASCSTGSYMTASTQCASCATGSTYVASSVSCNSCPTGTYQVSTGCNSCTTGTYNTSTSSCAVCPANYTYNPSNTTADQCASCASYTNYTYSASKNKCVDGSQTKTPTFKAATAGTLNTTAFTNVPATVVAPNTQNANSSTAAAAAVSQTCSTGILYNYAASPGVPTGVAVMDYPAIPNAWQIISTATGPIANESATTRAQAVPIVYNLKITQDGLLSLSYSYNGGATAQIITAQNITNSNGPLPSAFRFGFAGSTGGSSNIHEILCFKATPAQSSNGSGTINVYQNPTIKNGTTQLFLAYYFPSDWTGQLTAQSIGFDTGTDTVVINTVPNWDARCVLTGVNATTGTCSTGVSSQTAEAPTSRVMVTWNGTTGIPFEWTNLNATEQAQLNADSTLNTPQDRLNYLRGDRTNEINSAGVGEFRARDAVLGDIINSSPTWMGPPQEPYQNLNTWVDDLYPGTTQPENSGAETYSAYMTAKAGRLNVVYAGANDGFLHGFRAGTLDASGNLVSSTSMPNDGYEVLAYMPGVVLNDIHPTNSSGAVIPTLDYSNTQYAHNYYVDATPATGDVFFNGAWHTWLVGGLGQGGAAIYALNINDPSTFTEANAAYNASTDTGIVIGEWTPSNITCANNSTCGQNLGNTFGSPQIRRFHNGQWGAIIGNGFGSQSGQAGIYIMLINNNGTVTFYYLGTNTQTGNGIASPSSLDIDLDHIVDYIYAGDLQGNIWRFDVTSQNPSNWAVSASSPLFSGGPGQPITTRITVGTLKTIDSSTTLAGTVLSTAPERVIIDFGTGQMTPQTLTSPTTYAGGQQYLYGIWDWDMGQASVPGSGWNSQSPGQQAVSLTGPQTITTANMTEQTVISEVAATSTTQGYRTVSHNVVCWKGSSTCSGGSSLGWYMPLPDPDEQVIYDPALSPDGEFVVNTFVPSPSSILSCTVQAASGWSMGLEPDTGAGSPTPFFAVNGTLMADGVQLNGTGTPSFISSGQAADNNAEYLITQTNSGPAPPAMLNRQTIVAGQRLNWIQIR
jgi:type IV pilus assembly protein PilY1